MMMRGIMGQKATGKQQGCYEVRKKHILLLLLAVTLTASLLSSLIRNRQIPLVITNDTSIKFKANNNNWTNFTKSVTSLHHHHDEISKSSASSSSSSSISSSTTTISKKEIGWWSDMVPKISRVYTPWNGTRYGWCIPYHKSQQHQEHLQPPSSSSSSSQLEGMMYIKNHKAASSTNEGIAIHIAHHISSKLQLSTPCIHYTGHKFAEEKGHGIGGDNRDGHHGHHHHNSRHYYPQRQSNTNNLLWTMIRHPGKRDISHVLHFMISRQGLEITEENLYNSISKQQLQGRQTRFLLPYKDIEGYATPKNVIQHPKQIKQMIKKYIIEYYDFIGIVERMDESLAVMTFLWDLNIKDVIVLSAKRSGGYDDGGYQHQCIKIQSMTSILSYLSSTTTSSTSSTTISNNKTTTTSIQHRLDTLLKSSKYQLGHADFLLYYTAVESLDRTIHDVIGYEKVQERVKQIQTLQQIVNDECNKEAIYPCSANGTLQSSTNCYVQDAGCAHECVDRILSTL